MKSNLELEGKTHEHLSRVVEAVLHKSRDLILRHVHSPRAPWLSVKATGIFEPIRQSLWNQNEIFKGVFGFQIDFWTKRHRFGSTMPGAIKSVQK